VTGQGQFLRYALVGAVGTAVQYAILVSLVRTGLAPAIAASTVGAVAGALVNYYLNSRWTFGSTRAHEQALPRFAAIALAGIGLNAIVMGGMFTFLGVNYLLAQFVATGVVLVTGFIANRAWTF
jgi:putative flippase GtrA